MKITRTVSLHIQFFFDKKHFIFSVDKMVDQEAVKLLTNFRYVSLTRILHSIALEILEESGDQYTKVVIYKFCKFWTKTSCCRGRCWLQLYTLLASHHILQAVFLRPPSLDSCFWFPEKIDLRNQMEDTEHEANIRGVVKIVHVLFKGAQAWDIRLQVYNTIKAYLSIGDEYHMLRR